MRIYILACLLASFCAPAFAHHSVAVSFDTGLNVQVEGQITSIEWRNPHILFTLTATDGSDAEWEIETHSRVARSVTDRPRSGRNFWKFRDFLEFPMLLDDNSIRNTCANGFNLPATRTEFQFTCYANRDFNLPVTRTKISI